MSFYTSALDSRAPLPHPHPPLRPHSSLCSVERECHPLSLSLSIGRNVAGWGPSSLVLHLRDGRARPSLLKLACLQLTCNLRLERNKEVGIWAGHVEVGDGELHVSFYTSALVLNPKP